MFHEWLDLIELFDCKLAVAVYLAPSVPVPVEVVVVVVLSPPAEVEVSVVVDVAVPVAAAGAPVSVPVAAGGVEVGGADVVGASLPEPLQAVKDAARAMLPAARAMFFRFKVIKLNRLLLFLLRLSSLTALTDLVVPAMQKLCRQ